MSRRKKTLIGLAVAAVVLSAVLYIAGNVALTAASRHVLDSLIVPARQSGAELTLPDFDTARIVGFRSARWRGLRTTVELTRKTGFNMGVQYLLTADDAILQLVGDGTARFEASGVSAKRMAIESDSSVASAENTNELVMANRFVAHFPFRLQQPGKSLRDFLPPLIELLTEGAAPIRVATRGNLSFTLNERSVTLPFSVINADGRSWFALDPEEVRKLATQFQEDLTDAEVELLAEHPVRAPDLLRIKNEAEQTSRRAAAQNPTTPEDAYRHVLWSYLLTRRFGPEFAQQVTDAHELGASDNTAADHKMDYRNNEIGRQYADDDVTRNELLSRLQNDPRVIKTPAP